MTTATHNYGWLMPDPGGSANTWGNTLNGTTQAIDAQMWSISSQITVNDVFIERGPDGGANGQINFANYGGTQDRWILGETSEPEGAGNTGTNFFLNAYDNAGAYLGQAFEVLRSNLAVTFGGAVTVASLGVGGNAGVSGALGVTGNASVGSLTVVNTAGISGDLGVSGKANITGDLTGHSGNIYNQATSGGNSNYWFVRNDGVNMGVVYYNHTSQVIVLQNMIGGGQAQIDGVANFSINGGAFKPGGGAWTATSDARIKTVTSSYSSGLAEIAKLNPVRFTYKGNDGNAHALVKGREFVGLVADEAMRAMPELVSLGEGEIDGRKVSDLKRLDPTAIIYALINAVKELKEEISELKASR